MFGAHVMTVLLSLSMGCCCFLFFVFVFTQSFIPALLSTVLDDYSSSVCEARDAEALSLVDVIVKKFKGFMLNQIPDIMGVIFEPTLELITDNMTDFPQHRQNFFALLRSINKHCFGAFFELPMENFRVVVQRLGVYM